MNEQFRKRQTRTTEFGFFNFLGRHFTDDFIESALRNAFQSPPKRISLARMASAVAFSP